MQGSPPFLALIQGPDESHLPLKKLIRACYLLTIAYLTVDRIPDRKPPKQKIPSKEKPLSAQLRRRIAWRWPLSVAFPVRGIRVSGIYVSCIPRPSLSSHALE